MARTQKAGGKELEVHADKCSGCSYCQLACSFVKTGSFSWADSLIKVRRVDGKERYRVGFAAGCDRCGFCAGYCFFGALTAVATRGEVREND